MQLVLLITLLSIQLFGATPKYPTLEIGAQAPEFKLKGIDDKFYTLADYKKDVLVMILPVTTVQLHKHMRKESSRWWMITKIRVSMW